MKRYMIVKKNDNGEGCGVYLRDIPFVVATAVKEVAEETWAEYEERFLCFAIGAMATVTAFTIWELMK